MVAHRLQALLMIFIGVLPQLGLAQLPHFSVAADVNEVEYGRPLSIYLQSVAPEPLKAIDLSPLEKDFATFRRGDIVRNNKINRFSMRLRLYPRKQGKQIIPSLTFKKTKTVPIEINVTPAVDPRSKSIINVSSEINRSSVWLKQSLVISMEVNTSDDIVDINSPSFDETRYQSFVLPLESKTTERNGKKRSVHRLGWIIHSFDAGPRKLKLPAIEYRRDGIITHRFYPPLFEVRVKPLPPYVPVTMPVGKVELASATSGKTFYMKDRLESLSFKVRGTGLPDQYTSYLLDQLKSTDSVSIYPAQIQTELSLNETGSTNTINYQVPFVPADTGFLKLPTLRVQYFDPESGKIVTRQHSLGRVLAIPIWLIWFSIVLLISIGTLLMRRLYNQARNYWASMGYYRAALLKINEASSAQEFRLALTEIACGEFWQPNLTVETWYELWQRRYRANPGLHKCLNVLQGSLYGRSKESLDELRQLLRQICHQRMPLLRFTR